MDALSPSDKPPVVPLLGRAVEETWKPRQGNGYGTSVIEIYNQAVIRDGNVLGQSCSDFNRQSTHSKPSANCPCSAPQVCEAY